MFTTVFLITNVKAQIIGVPFLLVIIQNTSCNDIIVAAVGKRNVVTADMVKPGAVVIDVGMNRDDEGRLCGDVDFAAVKEVAGWITPVPGGVGPMTITMLMQNTIESFIKRESKTH